MYFKLRDMLFEIKAAKLNFYYSDEADAKGWTNQQPGLFLVIGVDTKENALNGEGWAPWLRHNSGIKIDISHWTELEGKQWIFNNAHDENHNEAGFLGIFEEEAIKKCRLEIIKRSGRKFTILWSGIGDVFCGDEYDSDVPFECEFVAEFEGIGIQQCVADQTEKGLRETLGKIINLDDFKLVDTKIGLKEFIFK